MMRSLIQSGPLTLSIYRSTQWSRQRPRCRPTLHTVHCTVYNCTTVQLYSVQLYNCTVYSVQLYNCTVYSVQLYNCTVYSTAQDRLWYAKLRRFDTTIQQDLPMHNLVLWAISAKWQCSRLAYNLTACPQKCSSFSIEQTKIRCER